MILCASVLVGLAVFFAYLFAHDRGYKKGLVDGRVARADEVFEREMADFWKRQEFLKMHGSPYMDRNYNIIEPDDDLRN